MSKMTVHDLHRILVQCAGEAEQGVLGADALDRDFDDLGYDSLALMETAAQIAKEYGVEISDERVAELRTPREVLAVVNGDELERG
ncbi:acyl carrier protein [Saccharothrix syringae]|uniref:Acyl carrier protein n=1 Tax=Saccharothrix syringae TaxID=103733 RepID=A0A5Q0GZ47_SACSY|nr:acyl carrier protein [Saccharothrix syringae]QFZ18804.1 acyl carrier protein [Saccharothrix syringae]